jgi:hypothetical protein
MFLMNEYLAKIKTGYPDIHYPHIRPVSTKLCGLAPSTIDKVERY